MVRSEDSNPRPMVHSQLLYPAELGGMSLLRMATPEWCVNVRCLPYLAGAGCAAGFPFAGAAELFADANAGSAQRLANDCGIQSGRVVFNADVYL